MRICVIPARGGSKRIPRKNIKDFNGQPIIGYSIRTAILSDCFDKVIVSTDDTEISEIAKSFGAEVPFLRPQELSDDHAGTIPVIKHAIEWYDDQDQPPSEVCCIYPTAPFVQVEAIRNAYEQLRRENAVNNPDKRIDGNFGRGSRDKSRHDRRGIGVGVGQPGVQREDSHLDAQANRHERKSHQHRARAVVIS